MFKALKWVYDLGKLHERRRIELAIRNYKYPTGIIPEFEISQDELYRRQDVEREIRSIIYSVQTDVTKKSVLDD